MKWRVSDVKEQKYQTPCSGNLRNGRNHIMVRECRSVRKVGTMKLYYAPGACSLSPHIVLRETGLPFTMEQVDLATKETASGEDYYIVNTKGSVPALMLDNGEVLTEGAAILQYLADLVPEKKLAPKAGTMERYRLMEALNYIATELHKSFIPIFNPAYEGAIGAAKNKLTVEFDYVDRVLSQKPYWLGEEFTVADAYLFTVSCWIEAAGLDIKQWKALEKYRQKIASRPCVKEVLQEEGL